MKDTFYFPHDFEARNDPKIIAMRSQYGMVGYGLYWCIIESLHAAEGHQLPTKEWQMLAIAKQCDVELITVKAYVKDCIEVYELFSTNGDFIWCERVNRNFKKREEISQKRAESGRKGGLRKQENSVDKQMLANAKQNVTKEKKEKEKKENNINIPFEDFWDAYGRKQDRSACENKWRRLTDSEREAVMEDIPKYKASLPEWQEIKYPYTYLNGKCWLDERGFVNKSQADKNETIRPLNKNSFV